MAAKDKKAKEEQKAMRIAAANQAAAEITRLIDEIDEADSPFTLDGRTLPGAGSYTALTDAGYRKVTLAAGATLRWRGKVRVGAKGNIIFTFVPLSSSQHLDSLKVTAIEIEHPQLETLLDARFNEDLTDLLGMTVEEMVQFAVTAVDDQDKDKAKKDMVTLANQEAVNSEDLMEDYGEYA